MTTRYEMFLASVAESSQFIEQLFLYALFLSLSVYIVETAPPMWRAVSRWMLYPAILLIYIFVIVYLPDMG